MSDHSVHVKHHVPRLVAVPTAGPMSHDDLEHAVEVLSRLLGEVVRRKAGSRVFRQVDEARMVALGLLTVTRVTTT